MIASAWDRLFTLISFPPSFVYTRLHLDRDRCGFSSVADIYRHMYTCIRGILHFGVLVYFYLAITFERMIRPERGFSLRGVCSRPSQASATCQILCSDDTWAAAIFKGISPSDTRTGELASHSVFIPSRMGLTRVFFSQFIRNSFKLTHPSCWIIGFSCVKNNYSQPTSRKGRVVRLLWFSAFIRFLSTNSNCIVEK